MREVVEDHRPIFAARAVTLTLATDGPHWVDADPTRLAQIVGNLLQNAAKFSNHMGTSTCASSGEGARKSACE